MHIKKVIIQGFKSYKDQLELEEFSPKHNAVVGRNGSGKSNFFRAIQFVLGEKGFTNLSHKERQEMLHEGAGANVMTAFVEIVFDNRDTRFPIDSEEVVLRRTIGLKKDEYFLNQNHVSKGDVVNLLESAGFSRSNPYYIVQQGKISALCLMQDKQRLDLLKEVAGTTVYEERRKASQQILAETKDKRAKIMEVLSYVEKRLGELKEEQQELMEYRSLDRQCRAMEYTLYDKELRTTTHQLEQLERKQEEEVANSNAASNRVLELKDDIKEAERQIKELIISLRALEKEKREIEDDRAYLIKQKASAELEVHDMEERVANSKELQQANREEMEQVEKKMALVEKELAEKTNVHKELQQIHQEVSEKLQMCKIRVDQLYDKQGRTNQFKTQKERDEWLQHEVSSLQRTIEDKHKFKSEVQSTLKQRQEDVAKLTKDVQVIEEQSNECKTQLDAQDQRHKDLQRERDRRSSERKEHWRNAQKLENDARQIREDLDNAKRTLKRAIPHHIALGLDGVEKIVAEKNLQGVYGPVYDLITPKHEKYNAAIETAAGNSLMHVIVDTDETAAVLIKELSRRKAGRVTFKPLNQARDRDPRIAERFEQVPKDKASPLLSQVEFKPMFKKPIESILGNVLLCCDNAVAGEFSRTYQVNCVTLDGDEVNRRGAMTGGFVDTRKSKLGAVAKLKEAKKRLEANTAESNKLKEVGQHLDQGVTQVMSEMDTLKLQCEHLRKTYKVLYGEQKQITKRLQKAKEAVAQLEPKVTQTEKSIETLEANVQSIQAELATSMDANLSSDEIVELKEKEAEIRTLSSREVDAKAKMKLAMAAVTDLERELQENLLRRREELAAQLDDNIATVDDEGENLKLKLETARDTLKELEGTLQFSNSRHSELEDEISTKKKEKSKLRSTIQELKKTEQDAMAELYSGEERVEKLLTKRGVLLQRRETSIHKIRNLGSLPSIELESFENLSTKKLMDKIQVVGEKLKKYSHVNKKARDQFVNFSDKREKLKQRIEELDEGDDAIKDLIAHLDRQKDEAILRTFRGVAKNFREVFQELVPTGRGELIMVTRSNPSEDQTTESDQTDQVEHFQGVCPKVSFTNQGEVCSMRQLSGGQKTLVALTLIFAIQRCDPAPFYLFDEIDQALDSNHRASVAALIRRQANSATQPAQFVTTTFRAELVEVADKVYGVSMQNKISSVSRLENSEGLAFVKRIIAEEEAEDETQAGQRRRSTGRKGSRKSLTYEAATTVQDPTEEQSEDGSESESNSDEEGSSEHEVTSSRPKSKAARAKAKKAEQVETRRSGRKRGRE